MSSFIVSHRCISMIVQQMEPTARPVDKTALGRSLLSLNAMATGCRYDEPASTAEVDAYAFSHQLAGKVATAKAMQSYLYQCSEGEIPDSSELFKRVQREHYDLLNELVRELPQYDRAPWG